MGRRLNERKRDEMLAGRLTSTDHPFDAISTKQPTLCKCGLSITDSAHQTALRFTPEGDRERRTAHAR